MMPIYEVSTKTSSACNKLLLKQRKCILDTQIKPILQLCPNHSINYLKQRNIINFNFYMYIYQTSILCISTAS